MVSIAKPMISFVFSVITTWKYRDHVTILRQSETSHRKLAMDGSMIQTLILPGRCKTGVKSAYGEI
ncbi:hypothetical protein B7H23_00615 [Notoacmeibacter marinus]|uniref:Uncharacterized protein n=1 Tax=Notoacmeibacter marinus TaxID=1876515 RepID=A0A231V090_9HYPH|nr:hypothetical protein B7H23_00615 [Notoacmeibacter marinus]